MAVTLNANTSTGFIATSDTSGVLQLQTGGTAAVTVDASQNVGIGTASPGVRLEVSGASAASSFNALRMANTDTTASSPVTTLFQSADDGTLRNRATMTSGSDGSNNGYIALSTRSSGSITEKFRLNSTGALVLAGGSTTANGVGITFPATQSASSDANTLDDYEEGNWTPTFVSDGGTTGTTTVTNRWGRYVKIGRQVTVNFGFTGSLSGFTGTLQIGGLPFSVVTETTYQFGGGLECTSSTATSSNGSNFMFFAFSNSLYPRYTTGQDAGYLFSNASQINGLTGIQGTMTYNVTT
jgi:hypothetical protein